MSKELENRGFSPRFFCHKGKSIYPDGKVSLLRAAEPAQAVTTHTLDDADEGASLFRQGILDAGRGFGEGLAHNDAILFERSQSFGKSFRANSL